MVLLAIGSICAFIVMLPEPALAWGPVTHIALGVQVLATVITPDHPLQASLLNMPEVFLYGSLAPDIVQGRRLQSRLRRHSHNWAIGLGLLDAAIDEEQRAFALGYLAHLAGDVVAHNFFLPARFIGRFSKGLASHIYAEARFDSLQDRGCRDLMLKLLGSDFSHLNDILQQAIETPMFSFGTHRAIFEGGLKRIREFHRVIGALGKPDHAELTDIDMFCSVSCGAIEEVFSDPRSASVSRFDPMGEEAIRSALKLRRNLQRLDRLGSQARTTARSMADTMLTELRAHLLQSPFAKAAVAT